MILFLETIHEHALLIDFSIFILIWIVHLIVYPSFHHISSDCFKDWHQSYCNRISIFVLPLMTIQVIESASACFFVGGAVVWVRINAVLFAWLITFFHSARIHRYLSENGKSEKLINSLLKGNLWRAICWSIALFVSWYQY